MKISEILKQKKPTISFEFFPPKTPEGEGKLFDTADKLRELNPSFISVTYGAMGTTRENTLRIVGKIKKEMHLEVAAHLTCVGHNQEEIEKILCTFKEKGIENIVALRGDPPQDARDYCPEKDAFKHANELVRFIRNHNDFKDCFDIAVAGYPECHIECRDPKQDLRNLINKVEEGAQAILTQLFFDNADFYGFVQRLRRAGITQPVIAGIMPVTHGPQISKFSKMCGAKIPNDLRQAIERYDDDQASIEAYGIDYATRQCQELIEWGADGLHFYTLNKTLATYEIFTRLGLGRSS